MLTSQETSDAIEDLRAAYGAFDRGDIDAAVRMLAPDVDWTEPVEFPGGGNFHGIEGVKKYLSQSRAGAAEMISVPEQFIPAGRRIVVFVHSRVLPKGGASWQDLRLADVYTFKADKVVAMHAFADRKAALRSVGVDD